MGLMTACAGDCDDIYNPANLPNLESLSPPRLSYLDCGPTGEKPMEIIFFFLKLAWNTGKCREETLVQEALLLPNYKNFDNSTHQLYNDGKSSFCSS